MADVEEEEEEVLVEANAVAQDEGEKPEDEAAEAEEVQEQDEAAEEDNADESEEDPFELLDEDSEDNEEQARMYREYLDLIKQIDCQNALINELKQLSYELKEKPCQTLKDRAEYKRLRICLDQENVKLNTMTNRVIQLQNNGSKRRYESIELTTTSFEDDLLLRSTGCWPSTKCSTSSSRKPKAAQAICDALDDSESDSDSESDKCCCSGRR